MNKALAISLSFMLYACSDFDVNHDNAPSELAEPTYGPEVALKGAYSWGFETSVIYLCKKSRKQCSAEPQRGCWVEFTETAYDQLSKLRGSNYRQDDFAQIWLEGTGRIARKPGNFGHLGAHDCQVELTAVNAIDEGPPWVLRPPLPPPPSSHSR